MNPGTNMSWTFSFWTPGNAPADLERSFGCASHGVAAREVWLEPDTNVVTRWPTPLAGEALSGSYAGVLAAICARSVKPAAVIALFARSTGMEAFLAECHTLLGATPMAGGSAARAASKTHGELRSAASEVALLLITQGAWRTDSLNLHDAEPCELEFHSSGLRTIAQLRPKGSDHWRPAADAFRALQAEYGRPEADCESITLCDRQGRNVHCSVADDCLNSGADLPADGWLALRTVTRAEAARRLADFCSVPGSLVFGCAGLRSLMDAPIDVAPGTLVGFMFGELFTLGGQPQFGNLMAARLVPAEDRRE